MFSRILATGILFLINFHMQAQNDFIYTNDGKPILNRRAMLFDCLRSMKKDRSDTVALAICECYVNKIDRHFTTKQYRKHTKNNIIDLENLIKEDSVFKKEIDNCFTSSGKTILLNAESFGDRSLAKCIEALQKSTNRKLDTARLKDFCNCQIDLIKTKKLSDEEILLANDPNSLFFFEVIYKCGDPFAEKDGTGNEWSIHAAQSVRGPQVDTVSILTLNGMSYVKLKIGSLLRIWLFDTGASDLLINKEMEGVLRKENILSDSNYLGIGEYEMANGVIDSCRKYRVNDVRIGKYYVDNITVAVSEKAKKTILGRSLLNKFRSWELDNRNNILILHK
jgi:hypothetical protein